MATWVRIADGLVGEAPITLDDGQDPNVLFKPTVYAPVPAGTAVAQGMTWDGKTFGPVPSPSKADLLRYVQRRQIALSLGGYSLNVAASGQPPKVVHADTSDTGRIDLAGLVTLAQIDQSFTTEWVQADGTLTLDRDEIRAVGVAVGRFYSATYDALGPVTDAVEAGALKTFADVDAASAWPATQG